MHSLFWRQAYFPHATASAVVHIGGTAVEASIDRYETNCIYNIERFAVRAIFTTHTTIYLTFFLLLLYCYYHTKKVARAGTTILIAQPEQHTHTHAQTTLLLLTPPPSSCRVKTSPLSLNLWPYLNYSVSPDKYYIIHTSERLRC